MVWLLGVDQLDRRCPSCYCVSISELYRRKETHAMLFQRHQLVLERSAVVVKLTGEAHPNIYEAVELFKAEQTATQVRLMQLVAGGLPVRRRRSTEGMKIDY